MRVLVAMSGGVDSSVAAARCLAAGHETVGVTMKLWGGASDTGCCSVADVDDARRVADQLGLDHHVFNFGADFDEHVVEPYVAAHVAGLTPNPCIECNRHVKFDRLYQRAAQLGFDAVATGHHARVVTRDGRHHLARGADPAKDQSYVLSMLGQGQLARTRFPVGELTKDEVRAEAAALGLRTAGKPDSQDVCFITSAEGRAGFLADRLDPTPADVVEEPGGAVVGRVDAVELVTIGQRRGLGLPGGTPPRYVTEVRVADPTTRSAAEVRVGGPEDLLVDRTPLTSLTWVDGEASGPVLAQVSAHGTPAAAECTGEDLRWAEPRRKVAPGQTVALYDPTEPDLVLGGAIAR